MSVDAQRLALSFKEQYGNNLRLSLVTAIAERDGGPAFLGHVLGAVVAQGELLLGRGIALERRLQVPQAVALLEDALGLAAAGVDDVGLGAHLGRCGDGVRVGFVIWFD